MGKESGIEWTDSTWNPVRGCTKISAGCVNCYAETFSERWRGIPGHAFEQGFDLRVVPEKLSEPLKWKKPRRIFVNSMSDLFHEKIQNGYIKDCFQVMNKASQHIFQILTKRADRMVTLMQNDPVGRFFQGCENIWFGVSVENIKQGFPRIDSLRKMWTPNRFLSIEPMLEALPDIDLSGIAWVIVGGESGPKARPIKSEWVTYIRDQCKEQGVPFFFKQWGGKNKKKAGNILDGKQYLEMPESMRKVKTDKKGENKNEF